MDFGTSLGGIVGGLSSGVISFLMVGVILAILGGIVFFAWRNGVLAQRPYRVVMFSPRGKDYKVSLCSGRFLKNQQFELFYGVGDVVRVQPPPETAIREGNIVFGYSPARNTAHWPPEIFIDDAQIRADPTASEALRLAHANAVKEEVDRATKPNPYEKYIVPISVVVGFVVIAIALFVAISGITKPLADVTASNTELARQIAANQLVVYRQVNTSSSSAFPNMPTTPARADYPPG